jgi:hypothetical protein
MTQWITAREAWAHVAHYESDKARARIFAKLIEGELSAWAEFYTFDGAEHRDMQMPQAFWDIQWSRLDFASGKATHAVFDCFCSINERGERVVKQHSNDTATGIRIDRDALQTFWPSIPETISRGATK